MQRGNAIVWAITEHSFAGFVSMNLPMLKITMRGS